VDYVHFKLTVLHCNTHPHIYVNTGFLWIRKWAFWFQKKWGISWLAEWLSASQERLCSMELVSFICAYTMVVCKVRGLTLLLRVGTLWRCGDGLFFEVPPLASDVVLITFHPLLENVLQTVDHFEISCLGAPFLWLEKPRNRMEARSKLNYVFGLEKVDRWNPIRTSAMQPRSSSIGSSEARNF
jgi:hypothetical protein